MSLIVRAADQQRFGEISWLSPDFHSTHALAMSRAEIDGLLSDLSDLDRLTGGSIAAEPQPALD